MVSSRFLFSIAILLLIMITQAFAQPAHFCINNRGNCTTNSTYHTNLNTLLSSLTYNKNGNAYGFYHSTYGQNSDDQVYAIGLCRGDVKSKDCRSCLNNSRYGITQRYCPNKKEAIGWYSNCMLRYSNRSMYGVMETKPSFDIRNPQNVSSSGVDGFNQELRKLLESVRSKAAAGGSLRKFAYGNATAPTFQTIFAIAQCTPEISEQACSDCLVGAFGEIPECCIEKVGGRVSRPSCNFRFEVYRFIEPKMILQLPSPPLILFPPPPSTNITTVSGGTYMFVPLFRYKVN
ncbi:cysteine-rich receptor-like protein kinase 10 isoform X2 [Prunus yedoensis var. nudiflora]|uniref:Cysteine-rich receptor-like protein kinase 10 isoform X2 n=1 Tax=Prunus yedoensis var. nudiflora TaxID=2094558 RepID=A0A314XFU0_PRUYE|nr:cysteine-rich receptor-like protein kinase 10 isoform X2 [Prunus yedoensis var. nudiflora]